MLSGLRNCGVDLAGYGGFGLMLARISTIRDLLTYQISNSKCSITKKSFCMGLHSHFCDSPEELKDCSYQPHV